MASPYPDLGYHPTSGLTFPWAEVVGSVEAVSDASFGTESGTACSMQILVFWEDIQDAIVQLIGYSWRDTSVTPSRLRRVLPWQHPYFNQLYVKRITQLKGLQFRGTNEYAEFDFAPAAGGAGPGYASNLGPWSSYFLAKITIQFWRPPYYVRSDDDILDADDKPQEWLRYLDKNWSENTQMLTREGSIFQFESSNNVLQSKQFQGSVGQKVTKLKIKRKWYQIPEAAIFSSISDGTPQGVPRNLIYTQTASTNPLTGYVYPAGSPILGCVNLPSTGGFTYTTSITDGSRNASMADTSLIAVGNLVVGTGIPLGTIVYSITNGTDFVLSKAATATNATASVLYFDDSDDGNQFLGSPMGTLLYESVEFTPVDLQLPPYLMQIPFFSGNEAISQVQYDVTMNFELFDPPLAPGEYLRGHNTAPFAGNGLWYPIRSQAGVSSIYREASLTSGSAVASINDTQGLTVGDTVTGVGVPAGTTISAITVDTDITLSVNATKTGVYNLFFSVGKKTTPFQYAYFTDLFTIL